RLSLASAGTPLAVKRAPTPSELRQPAAPFSGELLPHGQAVPDPSPAQKLVTKWKSATIVPVSVTLPLVPVLGSMNMNVVAIGTFKWNVELGNVSVPPTDVG